jgi:single-strand DNA-binding protein
VHKGERIGIEGRLTTRIYEDKEGNKRYVTEIIANEVLLLSSKQA